MKKNFARKVLCGVCLASLLSTSVMAKTVTFDYEGKSLELYDTNGNYIFTMSSDNGKYSVEVPEGASLYALGAQTEDPNVIASEKFDDLTESSTLEEIGLVRNNTTAEGVVGIGFVSTDSNKTNPALKISGKLVNDRFCYQFLDKAVTTGKYKISYKTYIETNGELRIELANGKDGNAFGLNQFYGDWTTTGMPSEAGYTGTKNAWTTHEFVIDLDKKYASYAAIEDGTVKRTAEGSTVGSWGGNAYDSALNQFYMLGFRGYGNTGTYYIDDIEVRKIEGNNFTFNGSNANTDITDLGFIGTDVRDADIKVGYEPNDTQKTNPVLVIGKEMASPGNLAVQFSGSPRTTGKWKLSFRTLHNGNKLVVDVAASLSEYKQQVLWSEEESYICYWNQSIGVGNKNQGADKPLTLGNWYDAEYIFDMDTRAVTARIKEVDGTVIAQYNGTLNSDVTDISTLRIRKWKTGESYIDNIKLTAYNALPMTEGFDGLTESSTPEEIGIGRNGNTAEGTVGIGFVSTDTEKVNPALKISGKLIGDRVYYQFLDEAVTTGKYKLSYKTYIETNGELRIELANGKDGNAFGLNQFYGDWTTTGMPSEAGYTGTKNTWTTHEFVIDLDQKYVSYVAKEADGTVKRTAEGSTVGSWGGNAYDSALNQFYMLGFRGYGNTGTYYIDDIKVEKYVATSANIETSDNNVSAKLSLGTNSAPSAALINYVAFYDANDNLISATCENVTFDENGNWTGKTIAKPSNTNKVRTFFWNSDMVPFITDVTK